MTLFALLRYAVFAAAALAVLAALAALAVQNRTLNPFGRPARAVRRLTDPLLVPIERRILKTGGNPQSAPWWLMAVAVVGGIIVVSAVEWLAGVLFAAAAAASEGSLTALIVDWAFDLVILALFVRIIGSWIGAGRYTRWMRPFYVLTEWLLAPLRRVVPPLGVFDVTPLVAWLLLSLARGWVLRAL